MKTKFNLQKISLTILALIFVARCSFCQSTVPGLANRNIAWPSRTPSSQFVFARPGFLGLGAGTDQNQTGEDWVYDIKPFYSNGIQTGYAVCGFTTAKNCWYSESNMTPPGLFWKDPIDNPNTPFNELETIAGDCERRTVHDEWMSQYRSMVGMYDLNGNLRWCRGGNHSVGLNSIITTPDGGFISIGDNFGSSYHQNGIAYKFNPTSSNSPNMLEQLPIGFSATSRIDHAIVSKYDANGFEQWSYLYGPESFGTDAVGNQDIYLNHCASGGIDIALNSNTGGYTLVGYSKNSSTEQPSTFIINITSEGYIVDSSSDIREITSLKGFISQSLSCDNGECIVSGRQIVLEGTVYPSAVLYKVNQSTLQNSTQWIQNPILSNAGDNRSSIFQDSYLDNAGNSIVTLMELNGLTGGSGINYGEGSIVKYDGNGVLVTSKSVGDIRAYDMRMGITPTNDGGYAIVSSKRSKDINGNDIVPDITTAPWASPAQNFDQQSSIPNYPVNCSAAGFLVEVWNTDTYVAKFNSNLIMQWEKQFDSDDKVPENYPGDFKKQECMYRIACGADGALVAVGNSSHNSDDYFAAKIFSDCQNKLSYNIKDVNDNVYETSTFELWDSPKKVLGKVLIKAGSTLTIENTTVEFADSKRVGVNTRIVIEPGGRLIVSNSILTSMQDCEKAMWDGIEVQGAPTLRQSPASNQGYAEFISSIVTNAREAITTRSLFATDNAITDWNKTGGGIVKAESSSFIDNRRDFEFMAYQSYSNSGALLNNLSSIRLCNFKTTDNYGDGGTMVNPAPHITMWKTRNITLAGNEFINTRQNVSPEFKGIGISAIDAAFIIDMTCSGGISTTSSPCPGPNVKSKFTDLYVGVIVSNGSSNTAFAIKNSEFDNNLYGVRIGGAHYGKVYNNVFNIPKAKYRALTKYAFGVYMDGSFGCDIQENVFKDNGNLLNNSEAGFANMGVFIANADLATGGVKHYRNYFEDLDVSTQAAGQNLTLQIDCNRFYHSEDNIFTDISAVAGVLGEQGSCGLPSILDLTLPQANEFFGQCNGISRVQIKSATTNIWNYNTFSTAEVGISPSCLIGSEVYIDCNVAINFNRSKSCPTAILNYSELLQKITETSSQSDKIDSMIDGGSTSSVIELIERENDGSKLQELLSIYSPYLSEEALLAVLNANVSSGYKTTILMENAPFTEKIRNAIYNSNLYATDINQLLETNGVSSLTTIINLTNHYDSENTLLENEVMALYISANDIASAYDYLAVNTNVKSLTAILPLILGTNNELVKSNIEKLLDIAKSFSGTVEYDFIVDYCHLYNQLIDINTQEGGIFTITQEQKNNLLNIAEKQEILAPIILNSLNFVSETYPYVDAYDLDGKKNGAIEQGQVNYEILPVAKYDYIIFPNPSTNVLNFDFNLGYQTNKSIEIISLTGQKVLEISTEDDLFRLETNSLFEGLYLVKVKFLDENRSTDIKRLVIQK